ncbi:MAG: phenylalanine--tRNA ligase subunit beta [Pseudomonadota bacterium]
MLFSESWLKTFIDTSLSSEQLAHVLTMAGLEVESFAPVAEQFSGVVVGKVLSVNKHPDAERLSVCTVDAGEAQPLQIVCGAKNVKEGIKVPCAKVGARLPGDFHIKPAKLRGIESFGMLCSGKELGIDDGVDGLLVLPTKLPIGQCIRDALDLNDHSFTLKVTPNRADCLSIQGIARELGALEGKQPHAIKQSSVTEELSVVAPKAHVDQALTPLFLLRSFQGLDNTRPTPLWMRQRLERCGIRSISLIVDITNYVMLELGQPLHAYDATKIQGSLHVRLAQPDETLTLLNNQIVKLTPETIVIADQTHALGLAGIMGGESSGVQNDTTAILLESAYWLPDTISGKARHYILSSDAAFRFERGVDHAIVKIALERASALILELAGGQVSAITDVTDAKTMPAPSNIKLRQEQVRRLLGFDISAEDITRYLSAIGCSLEANAQSDDKGNEDNRNEWIVTAPSWRIDLIYEVDLIEELARLVGYDSLPTQTPTPSVTFLAASETTLFASELKSRLVDLDYQETINFSFVSETIEQKINPSVQPMKLLNPIAQTMSVMRTSLWPGLLATLDHNLRRKIDRIRIFEWGRVFLSDTIQPLKVAGLIIGSRENEQWGISRTPVDFFDMKGDLQALFHGRLLSTQPKTHPALHPGRSAAVLLDGVDVGLLGELHPKLAKELGFSTSPILFELDCNEALLNRSLPSCTSLSDLPAVRRDLALVAPKTLTAQRILDAIKSCNLENLEDITIFDVFEGGSLETHLKSLAVRLQWQPKNQTLTDTDIQAYIQQILSVLEQQLNVVLRH